mmetsp:Transcript_27432/g.69106  ORF Transcript_27432/g.69106 Transcript_27432/m.69106 type:complete len:338 (-) Transcript_27432:644-1657(-)
MSCLPGVRPGSLKGMALKSATVQCTCLAIAARLSRWLSLGSEGRSSPMERICFSRRVLVLLMVRDKRPAMPCAASALPAASGGARGATSPSPSADPWEICDSNTVDGCGKSSEGRDRSHFLPASSALRFRSSAPSSLGWGSSLADGILINAGRGAFMELFWMSPLGFSGFGVGASGTVRLHWLAYSTDSGPPASPPEVDASVASDMFCSSTHSMKLGVRELPHMMGESRESFRLSGVMEHASNAPLLACTWHVMWKRRAGLRAAGLCVSVAQSVKPSYSGVASCTQELPSGRNSTRASTGPTDRLSPIFPDLTADRTTKPSCGFPSLSVVSCSVSST